MAEELSTIRQRVLVSGRVQGVGFRYHTAERAAALKVTGWVRNIRSGSVEVEVQGDRSSVEALVQWLRDGPSHARVESVETTTINVVADERQFRIIG